MSNKRIYLDYAALTPIDSRVLSRMEITSRNVYGNPSSITTEGVQAKKTLEKARLDIARHFHAKSEEILFTSGGTEANNLGILGRFKHLVRSGKKPNELHALTSTMEHSSVLLCFAHLRELGVHVDYISPDENGLLSAKGVKEKLKPNTFLVSIMYVNNEIGVVQPISEIGKVIRDHNAKGGVALFHVDACQAPLWFSLNQERLGADLMTIDGQKIYGPRGVGALYVKKGITLSPQILGGGQEHGLRSGTENVAGVAGLALALELAQEHKEKEAKRLTVMRNFFIRELLKLPGVIVNGDTTKRAPNNVNISIPGMDTEFLVLKLDALGFAASTKSSCLRDVHESYVVKALGGRKERASSTIRFSLGIHTKKSDLTQILPVLKKLLLKN